MFTKLFQMIQDREDFHACFELYREYIWRVIRLWHTYPEDNIHIDVFHTELYQQIRHAHLAQEASSRHSGIQGSGNSSGTSGGQSLNGGNSNATSQGSNQPFRNSRRNQGSRTKNYRRSDYPKTKMSSSSDDSNVCYKCGGSHHHGKHKVSLSDHLHQRGHNWYDSEG